VCGMKYELLIRKLAEHLIREATQMPTKYELEDLVTKSAAALLERSFEKLSKFIVSADGGSLRCGMCGKGPFTKRGLYLHLLRVHGREIERLVEDELKKALELTRSRSR